jgi:O-antigen/teichoic acid export membrane protein
LSTLATEPNSPDEEANEGLTGGHLLARNAVGNLLSQGGPVLAAVLTVPVLIGGLGTDRFGLLTLAWMLLGYFSLFDLGLGRALTKLVAEKLGAGKEEEVPALVVTAMAIMMALGLLGTLLIAALSPWLVHHALRVPAALQREAIGGFELMALALPFLIGTAGLRGVMEAHQRVGAINVLRTVIGIYSLVAPLIVLPFTKNLVAVVGLLVAGRVASWVVHLLICTRAVPGLCHAWAPRVKIIRPLLGYGGWMTVANIINPIMVQMDRLFIGGLISTAAVAYYTTPFELVTKFWIFAYAVIGVVFPAFATSYVTDRRRTALIFGRGVKYVFLILFPLTFATTVLAPEVLRLWLGPDFANESARVLQWLAAGVLLNGLAQVPSALLQGVGRPDLTALLHLAELVVYLPLAWFLISVRGIEGAAMAWTARTVLDVFLFFGTAQRILPEGRGVLYRLGLFLPVALMVTAVCAAPAATSVRLAMLATVCCVSAWAAWRRVLTLGEKAWILSKLATRTPVPRDATEVVPGSLG